MNQLETAQQILEIIPNVMRFVAAELRQSGRYITPVHIGVMTTLMQQPCNLSDLADSMAVTLPTMSNTISKLVQQGWVTRTRAPHDRRMLLIELTPAGRAELEEIGAFIIPKVAEMLMPLSVDEQETLLAGLNLLNKIFNQPNPST